MIILHDTQTNIQTQYNETEIIIIFFFGDIILTLEQFFNIFSYLKKKHIKI
jgi:hypothetical protein